jgi:hypothetical protein
MEFKKYQEAPSNVADAVIKKAAVVFKSKEPFRLLSIRKKAFSESSSLIDWNLI